jgi:hypothetical protein
MPRSLLLRLLLRLLLLVVVLVVVAAVVVVVVVWRKQGSAIRGILCCGKGPGLTRQSGTRRGV